MSNDDKTPEELKLLFAGLTPQEIEVLRAKFGIDLLKDYSPEELARQFQITRDKIREIEIRISKRPPDGEPPDAA